MVERKKTQTLKGNSWWAIGYALTSLKNYPTRNMGIALILAVGVALPTTVFVWAHTGTELVVTDYFSSTLYQMSLRPKYGAVYSEAEFDSLLSEAENHPYIEQLDNVVSTVGILGGEGIPSWTSYSSTGLVYAQQTKDCRVIFVTTSLLSNWTNEFSFEGNFSLSQGQILVSQAFVDYSYQVHNIELEIGAVIDIDVLEHVQRNDAPHTPGQLHANKVGNLTVVGIYQINSLRTQIGEGFPAMTRLNWDPLGTSDIVLGVDDSVMMLVDEVGEESYEIISNWGYFESAVLLRASQGTLIAAGPQYIGQNLLTFKTQIEEQFSHFLVNGLDEIWRLDAYVQTYLSSQVLTVIVFPVLIMSLMLTIFTSETSVSRRKGEISALRSKGASFNQVFATFMWESLILSFIGFVFGMGLSFAMAPLIGSTIGLFQFDPILYAVFLTHLSLPPLALVIAAAIAMYLPASYLLHVARRIDVSEVGQPMTEVGSEGTEEASIWRYTIGLGVVLSVLLAMPFVLSPTGSNAVVGVLIATLLLFIAAYLGSMTMRLVTAKLSGGTSFLLGEKSLYMSQSLRKRKGQFIPLLVILTLTLTTTTMMLIQTSSFEATLDNELQYAIGADMRVEVDAKSLAYNRSLLSYPGVLNSTPVIETWAQVGTNLFFFEGVEPLEYLQIGHFSADSFVSGTPESVLAALSNVTNGIVISQYYANLWNRTMGDQINAHYGTKNGSRFGLFEVVGIMKSAPGFGVASTQDLASASFAAQFGFQVSQGGFALVNLDFLVEFSAIQTADLFLVKTVHFADMTSVVEELESERHVYVFTVETFDISTQSYTIQLFLSGIQGLTMISFILCIIMGLAAIALFLGSAVLERNSEYAVFRAIGGTRRQVVSMVFGEFAGTVIAAFGISIILGVIFGYSMSILTFGISPFSPVLAEVFSLPFTMMLIILLLESIVMILSTYLPAVRAGSVNPAEALRNL